jgi:ketosteroid isomerase-like protein
LLIRFNYDFEGAVTQGLRVWRLAWDDGFMNIRKTRVASLVCSLFLVVALTGCSGSIRVGRLSADETAVLGSVQALFDAIEAKDADAARALTYEDTTFTSLSLGGEGWARRVSSMDQFAAGIAEAAPALREVMNHPRVFVDGPLAVVWTPYEFFIDGEKSHDGIDAFVLIREDGMWRVDSLAYTVRPPSEADSHD